MEPRRQDESTEGAGPQGHVLWTREWDGLGVVEVTESLGKTSAKASWGSGRWGDRTESFPGWVVDDDIGREHQQSFLAFHSEEERKKKSSWVVSKGCFATRWSYADLNDSGESQSEESVAK